MPSTGDFQYYILVPVVIRLVAMQHRRSYDGVHSLRFT